MDGPEFRTVFAGVRPARLAVLIDQGDQDWQETCRRIIECLGSTWGGSYSIIVPTDGLKIDAVFWSMLEAFDPDYICEYGKTYRDWKIASPQRYEELLQRELRNTWGDQIPPPTARESVDRAFTDSLPQPSGISPELARELKMRLSPFFFEDGIIEYTFQARTEPGYPLTALSAILPHAPHPDRLIVTDNEIDGVPPLWVESILGATYPEHTERIQACGVTVEPLTLGAADVFRLMAAPLNRGHEPLPDFASRSPLHFSMAMLGEYRSRSERTWELPALVVVGSTLRDFALYFGLSRIRVRVCWLLPSWLDAFNAARSREHGGGEPVSPSERHASLLAEILLNALSARRIGGIDFLSASLGSGELASIIDGLSAISARGNVTIKSRARVHEGVGDLFANPRSVFNTDNFAVPTTQQILEGKAAGFFPTPKPKGFATIVPFDHRWITELRVDGLSYPRHPALGEWLIRHQLLGTQGSRTGKNGLCYFCPNVSYFGGDIDTILVRPELHVPRAEAVFERLAESSGVSCRLSDKGFYSRDMVHKMGSLEYAAALLRKPRHFAVLEAYLIGAPSTSGLGRYLASDARRYLSMGDVSAILGDASEAVSLIDVLVAKGLIRRGTLLKCQYCRTADWFSMRDLADEYVCKRCARKQAIQSRHTFGQAEPAWYYQLDEVVYQGIRNDMQVPLLTLDYLRRKNTSFSYADELELWKANAPRPFIEIDLCCICEGVLTIGEAKTTERIDGGGKRERRSLTKYCEAAALLGARRFLLATSKVWSPETLANARVAFAGTNVDVIHLDREQILSSS